MSPPRVRYVSKGSHAIGGKVIKACPIGTRCHVNGTGLTSFGTAFPQELVSRLASSSVQIVATIAEPWVRVASATLIDYGFPNDRMGVILCAAHTLAPHNPAELKVLMFYEVPPGKAPPGFYSGNDEEWTSEPATCSVPQGRVVEKIEAGMDVEFDYAMYRIEMDLVNPLPSVPFLPKPGTALGDEVLAIAHPDTMASRQGQPTQAAAGKVLRENGPNYVTQKGEGYGYASFVGAFGMSGGGIFNSSGEIVGVLSGRAAPGGPEGTAFLNLGAVARQTPKGAEKLCGWVNGLWGRGGKYAGEV